MRPLKPGVRCQNMKYLIRKPTSLTSLISGFFSALGFIFIMYVKSHYELSTEKWNEFASVAGIIFFLIPLVFFVAGFEVLFGRFKNISSSTFMFPSNKNDFRALGRIIIWFITTGIIFVVFSGLATE